MSAHLISEDNQTKRQQLGVVRGKFHSLESACGRVLQVQDPQIEKITHLVVTRALTRHTRAAAPQCGRYHVRNIGQRSTCTTQGLLAVS